MCVGYLTGPIFEISKRFIARFREKSQNPTRPSPNSRVGLFYLRRYLRETLPVDEPCPAEKGGLRTKNRYTQQQNVSRPNLLDIHSGGWVNHMSLYLGLFGNSFKEHLEVSRSQQRVLNVVGFTKPTIELTQKVALMPGFTKK